MASDSLKTISLQLEDYIANPATLRTEPSTSAGIAKGPGFSVDFKVLYEVHGSFDPSDTDNASLLVIRVIPFPKDPERQFLKFSFKLSVQVAAEKKRQSTSGDDEDEDSIARFWTFEPASEGAQFVDIYTTNESRERMAQINAQVPITHGASLGGQLSGTNKSEFKKTHLLKVTSKEERNDSSMPSNVYNRVAWRIFPADKEQGIGDSFTVALLVKRPQGSRFQLAAEVDGDVGSFSANTKKFLLSGVGGRKQKTPLATFPLQPPNPKVPQGVLVGDLHRAAIDNVMRDIEEVGLHLPERVNPVKFNKAAISATNLELGSIEKNASGDDGQASAGLERSVQGRQGVQVPSATTHQVNIDKTEVVNAATTTSTASHDHQSRAVPIPVAPPVGSSTTEAAVALLLADLTQRQRLTAGGVQQGGSSLLPMRGSGSETTPPSKGYMARVRRHREMAALYERLAELHRDEAKEFLPPEEMAYAAGFAE